SLQPLADFNGQPVRPDPDFHSDMNRLIKQLVPLVPTESDARDTALDSVLLQRLLELTQGWYNELVHTGALLGGASDKRERAYISFQYVNTRKFLPQILSIRKLLPATGRTTFLASAIDQFIELLTYVHDGGDATSRLCKRASFRIGEADKGI